MSRSPLVEDVVCILEGRILAYALVPGGVMSGRRDSGRTEIVRFEVDSNQLETVGHIDGLVSVLAGQSVHHLVAGLVTRNSGSKPDGQTSSVIGVDVASGQTKSLLESERLGATTELGWSPDGKYVAVSVAGREPEGVVIVDGRRGGIVDAIAVDGGEFEQWDERGVWIRVRKNHPSGWFEAHLWDPDSNAIEAVSPVRAVSPDGRFDVRLEDAALVVTDEDGQSHRLEAAADSAPTPQPSFPATWLDDRRVVLEGRDPVVLDVSDRSMRRLLPQSPIRDFSIYDDIVVFQPSGDELWCGRLQSGTNLFTEKS